MSKNALNFLNGEDIVRDTSSPKQDLKLKFSKEVTAQVVTVEK